LGSLPEKGEKKKKKREDILTLGSPPEKDEKKKKKKKIMSVCPLRSRNPDRDLDRQTHRQTDK
jgi:hypothetical protein